MAKTSFVVSLRPAAETLGSHTSGYFKAGVVGWFASDYEEEDMIDVQTDMDCFRHIMGRFEGALGIAKSRGRQPLVGAAGEGSSTGRLLGGERLGDAL